MGASLIMHVRSVPGSAVLVTIYLLLYHIIPTPVCPNDSTTESRAPMTTQIDSLEFHS